MPRVPPIRRSIPSHNGQGAEKEEKGADRGDRVTINTLQARLIHYTWHLISGRLAQIQRTVAKEGDAPRTTGAVLTAAKDMGELGGALVLCRSACMRAQGLRDPVDAREKV